MSKATRIQLVQRRLRAGKERMGTIALTGLKPAMGFGAAATGLTDKELYTTRGKLMEAMPPWTPGASHTAKAALHGDPAAPFACATMMAWHKASMKPLSQLKEDAESGNSPA